MNVHKIASNEIIIFTPKGEIKLLQKESTIIDFAYEIDPELGNRCIGAKVNYKLVPLSYILQNGDQVEIFTSAQQKPTDEWLEFAKTEKARKYIKKTLH